MYHSYSCFIKNNIANFVIVKFIKGFQKHYNLKKNVILLLILIEWTSHTKLSLQKKNNG